MNKGMLVSELRSRYPKALGIRKRLAKGRVMLIQKHIIPAEEAKWAEENKQQAEIVKKYRKKWNCRRNSILTVWVTQLSSMRSKGLTWMSAG